MKIRVRKADGTIEYFKVEKLRRSLRRAGAQPSEVNQIVAYINKTLRDGFTTQEIYRRAFERLRHSSSPVAARYSLRRALFNLGPTGFPFEKFLARLFAADGYSTQTGITLVGSCADHEIDLAAHKPDHSFIAEAKFHARPGIKSDLQVAMYSYARFLDLKQKKICQDDVCGITEFWIITNTKFTSAAEKYATCVGMPLLSWEYPRRNSLHDRIQRAGIYPVTVLQGLSANQARTLISNDIILCSELLAEPRVLRQLHVPTQTQNAIIEEAKNLCTSQSKSRQED